MQLTGKFRRCRVCVEPRDPLWSAAITPCPVRSAHLSDIFREVDEDLRRDRMELLWKRHSNTLLAAAVLIVLATAAGVAWRDWQRRQDEALGLKFVQAEALAKSDPAHAAATLEGFAANGSDGYRLAARLEAATIRATGTDKPGGIAALKAITADSGVPQAYRDLATIDAASDALDTAPAAEIIASVQPLTVAPNPWRFTALEVTALAQLKSGNEAASLKIYQQLADDLDAPQSIRQRAAEIGGATAHQG